MKRTDIHSHLGAPRLVSSRGMRSVTDTWKNDFLVGKEKNVDVNEVEEIRRHPSSRQKDGVLGRRGKMDPIYWTLDEEAYTEEKEQIEATSGFDANPQTLELLPERHITHHGSTETSFNWSTSFDSPNGDTVIPKTGIKRVYVFDEDAAIESDIDIVDNNQAGLISLTFGLIT
jgi:hypothetical protein